MTTDPMKEVYTCANPETCPHPLHKMSVDDFKGSMLRQGMMRSMSQPAGWKATNRRAPESFWKRWGLLVVGVMMFLIPLAYRLVKRR